MGQKDKPVIDAPSNTEFVCVDASTRASSAEVVVVVLSKLITSSSCMFVRMFVRVTSSSVIFRVSEILQDVWTAGWPFVAYRCYI